MVGKAWPDALEVSLETVDRSQWTKDVVSAGLAIAFVVLLFALTGHAMATKNEAALSEVMGITKLGLICVGVWAGGRAALKALSQWKDHDD